MFLCCAVARPKRLKLWVELKLSESIANFVELNPEKILNPEGLVCISIDSTLNPSHLHFGISKFITSVFTNWAEHVFSYRRLRIRIGFFGGHWNYVILPLLYVEAMVMTVTMRRILRQKNGAIAAGLQMLTNVQAASFHSSFAPTVQEYFGCNEITERKFMIAPPNLTNPQGCAWLRSSIGANSIIHRRSLFMEATTEEVALQFLSGSEEGMSFGFRLR